MTQQSTTPNAVRASANRRNLSILGVTAIGISLAVSCNAQWFGSTPAPVEAQPVAATATHEQSTDIALQEQIARLELPEQIMTDDGIECKVVDEVGRQHCVKRIASIKERYRD